MSETRIEHVSANGVRLWTVTHGTPPGAMVLLHGGFGHYDNVGPVAKMIDDLLIVHRYDQRGCGRSEKIKPYNIETFVNDLEALRIHWGHERWIVGGHSAGCSLTLAYAMKHPQRVSAMILISGAAIERYGDEYQVEQERRLSPEAKVQWRELESRRMQAKTADELATAARDWYCLQFPTDCYDYKNPPPIPPLEFAGNLESNRDLNASWRKIMSSPDIEERIRRLKMPAFVIEGEGDPRPRRIAERVAKLLPNSRFVILPKCGHYPWLERPEALRTELRHFLAEA